MMTADDPDDPDDSEDLGAEPSESRSSNPIRAGVAVFVAAYLVLVASMVGAGTLITGPNGVTRWDLSINHWFVGQRVDWLDTATMVGSHLAATSSVIVLGLLVVAVLWFSKDWDSIGLLVVALGLEVTVFLTTTLLVDRSRPPVRRMDGAPPTSSSPAGTPRRQSRSTSGWW